MSIDEMSTSLVEQGEAKVGGPAGSEEKPTLSVAEERSIETGVEEVLPVAATVSKQAEASTDQHTDDIQVLGQRVEQLAGLLDEANLLSRERERIVDRLHQENQQLRAGEIWQALAPVLRDLIRLYDDLEQTAQRYEDPLEQEAKEAGREFQSFRDTIEDILYRHGVERYLAAEGTPFNSKEQRALGVVPTPDENLDRTIARVVRAGFRAETRIVRLLEAEVFRFTPMVITSPNEEEGPEEKEASTAD